MLVLKDFFADWCGPCQTIKPLLEELEGEYAGKIKFEKINVDENPAEVQKYAVMSIPTLVLEKDGQELGRKLGAVGREPLKSWLDAHL